MLLEMIVEEINDYIEDKNIIEIVCGDGKLSKRCASIAENVVMTDVHIDRINQEDIGDNVKVEALNASQVHNYIGVIDTILCLDGLGHMEMLTELIVDSCVKKVQGIGTAIFASTRQMDLRITDEILLPVLGRKCIPYHVIERNKYKIVIITPE